MPVRKPWFHGFNVELLIRVATTIANIIIEMAVYSPAKSLECRDGRAKSIATQVGT